MTLESKIMSRLFTFVCLCILCGCTSMTCGCDDSCPPPDPTEESPGEGDSTEQGEITPSPFETPLATLSPPSDKFLNPFYEVDVEKVTGVITETRPYTNTATNDVALIHIASTNEEAIEQFVEEALIYIEIERVEDPNDDADSLFRQYVESKGDDSTPQPTVEGHKPKEGDEDARSLIELYMLDFLEGFDGQEWSPTDEDLKQNTFINAQRLRGLSTEESAQTIKEIACEARRALVKSALELPENPCIELECIDNGTVIQSEDAPFNMQIRCLEGITDIIYDPDDGADNPADLLNEFIRILTPAYNFEEDFPPRALLYPDSVHLAIEPLIEDGVKLEEGEIIDIRFVIDPTVVRGDPHQYYMCNTLEASFEIVVSETTSHSSDGIKGSLDGWRFTKVRSVNLYGKGDNWSVTCPEDQVCPKTSSNANDFVAVVDAVEDGGTYDLKGTIRRETKLTCDKVNQ